MSGHVPRWLFVSRDHPRASRRQGAWCVADGEDGFTWNHCMWLWRSGAHRAHVASLRRRGVYDQRWTVMPR